MENIRRKAILNRARTTAEAKSRSGSVKSVSESSGSKATNDQMEILKSIIDSQESVISKKAFEMLTSGERGGSAKGVSTPKSSLSLRRETTLDKSGSLDSLIQSRKKEARAARLELLRRAIEEDFDKFANIYKQQQLDKKKKKDNAKRLCLVAEILVFLGVIIMTVIFTRSVWYHLEIIRRIPKLRESMLNATANTSTTSTMIMLSSNSRN